MSNTTIRVATRLGHELCCLMGLRATPANWVSTKTLPCPANWPPARVLRRIRCLVLVPLIGAPRRRQRRECVRQSSSVRRSKMFSALLKHIFPQIGAPIRPCALVRSPIIFSASLQDVQYAAGAHRSANRSPIPPMRIGNVDNCVDSTSS